jgi:hypothetical protein
MWLNLSHLKISALLTFRALPVLVLVCSWQLCFHNSIGKSQRRCTTLQVWIPTIVELVMIFLLSGNSLGLSAASQLRMIADTMATASSDSRLCTIEQGGLSTP